MVAALYYGLKEIDNLIKSGVIIYRAINPVSRLQSANIETGPSRGNWWSDQRFLASVWVVAIAEPTPVGEVVAITLSAIAASYLIVKMTERVTMCINRYVMCQEDTPWLDCYFCLRYCTAQGVWNCY